MGGKRTRSRITRRKRVSRRYRGGGFFGPDKAAVAAAAAATAAATAEKEAKKQSLTTQIADLNNQITQLNDTCKAEYNKKWNTDVSSNRPPKSMPNNELEQCVDAKGKDDIKYERKKLERELETLNMSGGRRGTRGRRGRRTRRHR